MLRQAQHNNSNTNFYNSIKTVTTHKYNKCRKHVGVHVTLKVNLQRCHAEPVEALR